MSMRLSFLLFAALPLVAQAPAKLPPDINPVPLSRLPPIPPDDLDKRGSVFWPPGLISKQGRDRPTSRSTRRGNATSGSRVAKEALSALGSFSLRS
jgi:hypothetical protein